MKQNALPTDKLRTNPLRMLLTVGVILVVVYYGTLLISSGDPLWFTTGFSEQPVRAIIYHDGQRTELASGQPGFADLAQAVQQSLNTGVAYASGIGFSPGSLDDAYNMFVTLEVFFDHPVKLHATFNTGRATQMMFPLTGRHSDQPLVVLGINSIYLVNAPVLKTVEPVRTVMRSLGYLP
jgi:hypothetical protein